MLSIFGPNTLWSLVAQSDFLSKLILLGLLLISMWSWTLALYKFFSIRTTKKELDLGLQKIHTVSTLEELITVTTFLKNTVTAELLTAYFGQLRILAKNNEITKKHFSFQDMERLQYSIDQNIEDLIQEQSTYLPFLAITAATGPLLGLLGTVWGLIHSFMDISATGEADLTVVAPGIAEALITTLAGMLVAIPALVMYHYLIGEARKVESVARKISDHFESIVYSMVTQ